MRGPVDGAPLTGEEPPANTEPTTMTDRKLTTEDEKYAPIRHVSRNRLGQSRLLITFLSLTTRLTLFLTSARSKVSQNVLVNQGTDYWCGIVNHSLDHGLSTVDLHERVLALVTQAAEELKQEAKATKPKASKTARQAGAKKPEPVNPKPRRTTKSAK